MQTSFLKRIVPFAVLAVVCIAGLFTPSLSNFNGSAVYNKADIAWVLVSTALVFLMTPGLAFFYGGMVNRRNVLSTMIKDSCHLSIADQDASTQAFGVSQPTYPVPTIEGDVCRLTSVRREFA